ncbi:DUF1593 domain-containing protein [Enterobacteriales bacterium SAP-6]|uniref:DUF1593 domain-containing protein n=2 Tax=Acerihabitans arboris TaxID=2691583 RepID=A0A845SFC1_9GAMM|nr:DUF1593 domain-containing protein [Acerihabitans arboris]
MALLHGVALAIPVYSIAASDIPSLAAKTVSFQARPRVFVLTDIGNEPDDQMSMTRFLLYSNEMNVEGLVATTSTWQRDIVHPDIINLVLGHYAEVQPNLLHHDSAFPAASALRGIVASGQGHYGMAAVGKGKSTQGSDLLLRSIENSVSAVRPLYISLWGGANTLAQALNDLKATHSAAEVETLTGHLIVYAISDQDDAGIWIRNNFSAITYIVDPSTQNGEDYARATWTGISGDKYYRNAPGADFTTVANSWLDRNIRGKGPMGKGYPQYMFIMEGDTPSYLGLIRNGLNSEMNPGWGGWGGRYILRQPHGETRPVWTSGGDFFPGNPNAADTVIGSDGKSYTSNQATIWRWREAYQHDFAARMDWTIKDFAHANHNPMVVVNNHSGKDTIYIAAQIGKPVVLDAQGTKDPDGNRLSYRWIAYPEAGSATSKQVANDEVQGQRGDEPLNARPLLAINGGSAGKVTVTPQNAGIEHIILAVQDDGLPSLTSYRRVIITVNK